MIELVELIYDTSEATLAMTTQGADFAIAYHGIVGNADKPGKGKLLFGSERATDNTAQFITKRWSSHSRRN